MTWTKRNLDQDWYEGTLPQDKPFCRILLNDFDYGIYNRDKKEFLSLVSILDKNTVFYKHDFNDKYMTCQTKEEIESMIAQIYGAADKKEEMRYPAYDLKRNPPK